MPATGTREDSEMNVVAVVIVINFEEAGVDCLFVCLFVFALLLLLLFWVR